MSFQLAADVTTGKIKLWVITDEYTYEYYLKIKNT
jgi:hypothetical protein